MDWYLCCKTFIRVVEEKSFSKASKVLFTNQSVVSKRINWLESRLDIILLKRSTRRLELTSAGDYYYKHISPLIEEWDNITKSTKGASDIPRGTLRIAAPMIAGSRYLAKILPNFMEKYPEVKIFMFHSNTITNLLVDQVDVYICGDQNSHIENSNTKILMGPVRRIYASQKYINTYGEPKTLEELKKLDCLLHTKQNNKWEFLQDSINVSGKLESNSIDALIQAAISGLGIIYVSESFVDTEVNNGQLKLILPEYKSTNMQIYIHYSSAGYVPLKTQAFVEFFTDEFPKLGP